jgi:hypothetical protein
MLNGRCQRRGRVIWLGQSAGRQRRRNQRSYQQKSQNFGPDLHFDAQPLKGR